MSCLVGTRRILRFSARRLDSNAARFALLYLAIGCVLFCWASVDLGIADSLRRFVPPFVFALAAVSLFSLFLYSAVILGVSPLDRKRNLFCLPLAIFLSVVLSFMFERLLPPSAGAYSRVQVHLQRQLERRNTQSSYEVRGHTLKHRFNALGFADDEWGDTTHRPIVFIGDSFLEVRSSLNLAECVENSSALLGKPRDVVNLSQADSGLDWYRFLLKEMALPLMPSQVFLFLYEANDLSGSYKYAEYAHQNIRVTKAAVAAVAREPVASAVLRNLYESGGEFASREEFVEACAVLESSPSSATVLAYLATYAWSSPQASSRYRLILKLRSVLQTARGKYWGVVSRSSSFKESAAIESVSKSDWKQVHSDLVPVYDEPLSNRLTAMARVLASYQWAGDVDECSSVLASQSDEFWAALCAQSDATYYLVPALKNAFKQSRADVAGRYIRALGEMNTWATECGASLTVVLIPEASHVDSEFRQFWLPLYDFTNHFPHQRRIYEELANAVESDFSLVDLSRYTNSLTGAYWKFDGHFNEKGNAAVGEILASRLAKDFAVK